MPTNNEQKRSQHQINHINAAAVMKTSSESAAEERDQWADVESMMAEMLSSADDNPQRDCANPTNASADVIVDSMSLLADTLRTSSREISSAISASIEREREALDGESDDLSRQMGIIHDLEERASSLEATNADLLSRRREAECAIPVYAAAASEDIGELDEIESKHVRMIPKIKKELSLHATMTNIKWDYGRLDVLAGEVSIPGKSVHRRFAIEREEMGEFEIAERLWGMVEG